METQRENVVRIGSLELRFLVDETQGAGNLLMFEMLVPHGARVPAPHYHREVDEAVYGLDGTLTFSLDGESREVRSGESLFIPRGSVHGFNNLHSEAARCLSVLTPGSIGRGYFEEIAAEVNVAGKPDLLRIKDVMLRHGLVPV